MVDSRDKLAQLIEGADIDVVGVVMLDDWPDTPLYEKVKSMMPEARSVIILGQGLFPELVKYLKSDRKVGELSLRDLYNRNTEIISGHIDWEAYRLIKRLHGQGYQGILLPAGGEPFDSRFLEGVFSYKHAARLAGMGILGWNSLLLNPDFGGRMRLACIITDIALPPSPTTGEYDPCPKCGGACIKICPVSAIKQPPEGEDYKIDKHACSNYYNAAGGCAECLRVCPAGKS